MMLGQGEGETKLRSLAAELGISDRVIFAGFQADPSPFYAAADLFVLSSDLEGLPTVLIEALSFGLPVVSTDCPSGPAEILENGRWGRLVPVGDADALARAMGEALAAPVDREALKRRAADFSPEIAARKYLELLGLS
jgi:glycosyltransferase involved in cell wall biosynthesis